MLSPIVRESRAPIPTDHGLFQLTLYRDAAAGKEHLAVSHGDLGNGEGVLVRIHSECFTGDVLGSLRCDCGDQLDSALRRIVESGAGVVLYLRQEGRGIGLSEKLRAYNLQDLGYDTVDANRLLGHAADGRDYSVAVAILEDLGVRSVRLLSNNPAKVAGLEAGGIRVVERVPLAGRVTPENLAYLKTKVRRMEHLLDVGLSAAAKNGDDHGERRAPLVPRVEEEAFGPLVDDLPAGRPFVTLSYAQSLDGSIAAEPGSPLSLSGAESMTLTHRLRAVHQGILVGIGTVLADDPQLTVRLVRDARDPVPVILDAHLRTPPDARLFAGGRRPWIVAAEADGATEAAERRLIDRGARILRVPTDAKGRLRLEPLLALLRDEGMESLMVEGGARVITSFLGARLVDHLVVTLAPTLVGGVRAVRRLTSDGNGGFPRLDGLRHRRLGDDLVLSGRPSWNGAG